jgi:hypothetical protein
VLGEHDAEQVERLRGRRAALPVQDFDPHDVLQTAAALRTFP